MSKSAYVVADGSALVEFFVLVRICRCMFIYCSNCNIYLVIVLKMGMLISLSGHVSYAIRVAVSCVLYYSFRTVDAVASCCNITRRHDYYVLLVLSESLTLLSRLY